MRRSGSGTHVVVAWVRGWMLINLSHLRSLLLAIDRSCEATPPPPSWGYARGRDYPRTPRPPRLPVARVAALALISIPRSSLLAFFPRAGYRTIPTSPPPHTAPPFSIKAGSEKRRAANKRRAAALARKLDAKKTTYGGTVARYHSSTS